MAFAKLRMDDCACMQASIRIHSEVVRSSPSCFGSLDRLTILSHISFGRMVRQQELSCAYPNFPTLLYDSKVELPSLALPGVYGIFNGDPPLAIIGRSS